MFVRATLVELPVNLLPGGLITIVKVDVFVLPPLPVARMTKL